VASPNLIFDPEFGLLMPEIVLRHVVLPKFYEKKTKLKKQK
jgi:hypothetical protein